MDPVNSELTKRVIKKPGVSASRMKALDSLFQAKTTGISRTAQYEDEKQLEEEKEEENEQEDDFIEKDEYDYEEEEEEEELEVTHNRKKKVKTTGTTPIFSFMKPTTNPSNQIQKKAKETQQGKNKIDEGQSKEMMDALFKDFFTKDTSSSALNSTRLDMNQTSQQISNIQKLKPSENFTLTYKSNLEKSKDVYDFAVKPLKKIEDPKPTNNPTTNIANSSNSKPKTKVSEPIFNPNRIEEEIPIDTQPISQNIITNPLIQNISNKANFTQKTNIIHQKPVPVVELTNKNNIEEEFQEPPVQNTEPHNDQSDRMNIENDKWMDINANSDVLLTGATEISKDHNEILDEDGNILMYYYDAYEDNIAYPGIVFLFGKVRHQTTKTYESCCIMIKNIQRNVYFSPRDDDNVDFKLINQEIEEIKKKHFSTFSFSWTKEMKKKKYAFELPISYQERDYLLLKYGFEIPALPHDLKGKTFDHVLGTTYSALELFILKRKIRGPQWILIKNGNFTIARARKSWCPYEFVVEKKKNVHTISKEMNILPPPLKTLSFSLKTMKQETSRKQELIIISCLFTDELYIDNTNKSLAKSQVFSLVRKLDDKAIPPNLDARFKTSNKNIKILQNEYALLELFINRVNALDPDILIGHDLYSNLFEKVITRIQDKKINNWSRLGRLQKFTPPKGNSNLFKTRYATVGRLLCDTYLSAREVVREPDYSLEHLAKTHLGLERKIINEEHYLAAFDDQQKLIDLIESTAYDAFLTMEIMNKLEILPLTKELTTTAGNLWIKSLQNSRAERNEMLLMHEFYQNNYIFPDRFTYQHDDKNLTEDPEKTEKQGKNKKKYAGGLVLEPKKGLYDKYILLLDFNSLYPSLIQEYNICFTTVKRPSIPLEEQIRQKLHKGEKKAKGTKENKEITNKKVPNKENNKENDEESDDEKFEDIEEMVTVDETNDKCILPKVIRSLVEKRRAVKNLLKKAESMEEKQNLDIKQKALKLIANSIYGCLGFSSSRFYAKPLAALITKRGRETLEKSVALVRDKLGYEVIYGDTDSMMINSNCEGDQLGDALKIGFAIKKEINQLSKNKKLEIDIDGVFKPLLLLRKKKYAAKKIVNLGNILMNPSIEPIFVQELKGLDMVRRDWCDLSKNTSQAILNIILSGKSKDDVIFEIIDTMKKTNERLKGNCSLKEFLLTKQLTKHPNDYPGGKNLPHVVVAKRLRENGESDANLVGHFIHFLICKGENKALSDRAYHPREFKEKEQELELDMEYYKSQQIMPPIMRIIVCIEGLSGQTIAECLELNPAKYRNFDPNNDPEQIHDQIFQNEENELETGIASCDKVALQVFCVGCKEMQNYKGIWDKEKKNYGLFCRCGTPFNEGILLNMIMKYMKEMTERYYEGFMICQEESCGAKVRQLRLKEEKCPLFDCKSKVVQILQEKRIYQNFRHLKNLFDFDAFKTNNKNNKEFDLQPATNILETFSMCKRKIQEYSDKCVINLGSLFKFYGVSVA